MGARGRLQDDIHWHLLNFWSHESDRLITSTVSSCHLYTIGSFSNDDRDGNVNVKKAKHNFARAAHMFLYISFNDVTARLRRENA